MGGSTRVPYEFDELTANDVLDEVHGVVIRVLDLPKDEHLRTGGGLSVMANELLHTIWEISCVYL